MLVLHRVHAEPSELAGVGRQAENRDDRRRLVGVLRVDQVTAEANRNAFLTRQKPWPSSITPQPPSPGWTD